MEKRASDQNADSALPAESCRHGLPGSDHAVEQGQVPLHPDLAVGKAARIVERKLIESYFGVSGQVEMLPAQEAQRARAHHSDPAANAPLVKQAAGKLGAEVVGICRPNPSWMIRRQGDVPESLGEYAYAVVMGVAMDSVAIATSPAPAAAAATSVGYMRMSVCASGLALFIRQCGYAAAAAGNDRGMSVPLAVAAGLGELGRNGMVVTRDHGPCVRICKVFTDMPLLADEPIEFGVKDLCEKCGKCVEDCPAGAIAAEWSPLNNPSDLDTRLAGHGWVSDEKCRAFWRKNGNSCATCIAVCPFTRGEETSG